MVCNLVTWIGYSKFQNWSKLTWAPSDWTYTTLLALRLLLPNLFSWVVIARNDSSTVPASTCKESNWKARFRWSNGKDLVQFERYKLWAECSPFYALLGKALLKFLSNYLQCLCFSICLHVFVKVHKPVARFKGLGQKRTVTGKFACNNSSLYRKQTCWNDLKSEAAGTKIRDYNQSKLIISQLTWLKTVILGH